LAFYLLQLPFLLRFYDLFPYILNYSVVINLQRLNFHFCINIQCVRVSLKFLYREPLKLYIVLHDTPRSEVTTGTLMALPTLYPYRKCVCYYIVTKRAVLHIVAGSGELKKHKVS
jgi:hypothetical protein